MCLMLLHYCFCLQASGGLANSIYVSVAKEVEGVVCMLQDLIQKNWSASNLKYWTQDWLHQPDPGVVPCGTPLLMQSFSAIWGTLSILPISHFPLS